MDSDPNIPIPGVDTNVPREKPPCELYDGEESTAWVCKGWITKTNTCLRRDDVDCDGYGHITPKK